ncbi:MAG: hypothetical protein EXR75_07555 [Myxococcales bacterium]|nr:hypothetical protein [Myxococcales bacterium]
MTHRLATATAIAALALTATGCGQKEVTYQAEPAYSGKRPNLPAVPTLPNKPKKEGDSYTVPGAIHDLRSEVRKVDFEGKEVSIVGYIVKTNFETLCKDEKKPEEGEDCVPSCAVHKEGKGDPEGCAAPSPTFWIAESKDEKDIRTKAIQVKGWASNFAKIYTFVEELDKDDKAEMDDVFTGLKLPKPLPIAGAKVKVTGTYAVTFSGSSGGSASNPRTGIIGAKKIETVTMAPMRAKLPGMKVRNPSNKP